MMKKQFTYASREDIEVVLSVKEGHIPQDMYGHVFMNSMCGTVNSTTPIPEKMPDGSKNSDYGEMIFNGDGMVFRFDLDTPGIVKVKSKLMKPPCYFADEATKFGTTYYQQGFHFKGMGMARNSNQLGTRNQLNTSLNAFKFPGDSNTRLTVNFDAGRPFEMDPLTMELKTAIGANKEWAEEFPLIMQSTFPLLQSTAHPSFDPVTKEYYTVNFLKSAANLAFGDPNVLKSVADHEDLVSKHIHELHDKLQGNKIDTSSLLALLSSVIEKISHFLTGKSKTKINIDKILQDLKLKNQEFLGMHNAVSLIKWDGNGPLQKWNVTDENGNDLVIAQTMHQTNFSKDYLVIVDSSLKFALDILFSDPIPDIPWLDELLRWITSKTILPETPLYIINRKDLNTASKSVKAIKVIIPLETVHYSIDYDNPEDIITIHTAHNTASCAAEWVRPYDKLAVDLRPIHKNTIGLMTCGEMDIGRIGKFEINGMNGKITNQNIIHSKGFDGDNISNLKAHTWAVGLNTYRDIISADTAVKKIRKNYWQSYGLDKRLLTQYIWSLYFNYQNRIVPADKLLDYTRHGVPFCLFRQDTDTMQIDNDFWVFEMNQNFRSLQFIPRFRPDGIPDQTDPDTDGYILCTMVNGVADLDNDLDQYSREIWIFDAAALSAGPVCKLEHPDLQYSYTIHSVWIPDCASSATTYNVSVQDDYNWVISQFPDKAKQAEMQEFMEKNVYPHYT